MFWQPCTQPHNFHLQCQSQQPVPMIIAEIKSAYDKSITAGLFPDEGFREDVCEWVESERDSK